MFLPKTTYNTSTTNTQQHSMEEKKGLCVSVLQELLFCIIHFIFTHLWISYDKNCNRLLLMSKTLCSPSWELELRPLGVATGNAFSVTRVWRYICKNTIRWPATAHDFTTGTTIIKGPPGEYIISFSSSSLTGLFEETCILVGIQFSFIYHGEH